MKRILLLLAFALASLGQVHAQFDFAFDKLSDIGSSLGGGDGYINTINDVRSIQQALILIDDSRCMIERFDDGIETYRDDYGADCFDDAKFKMLKVRLDNSAIVLADQLAAQTIGVANIIGDVLGKKGDKAQQKTLEAINKSLVSDAIEDATQSLFAIDIEMHRIKDRAEYLERMGYQDFAMPINNTVIVGVNQELQRKRNSNFQKMQSLGTRYMDGFDGVIGIMINGVVVILLIGTGYTLATKGESVSIPTLIGLGTAIITLSIANTLI